MQYFHQVFKCVCASFFKKTINIGFVHTTVPFAFLWSKYSRCLGDHITGYGQDQSNQKSRVSVNMKKHNNMNTEGNH